MTVLSNVSENENAVSRVQVWLNGIVEAFVDGNLRVADHVDHALSVTLRPDW